MYIKHILSLRACLVILIWYALWSLVSTWGVYTLNLPFKENVFYVLWLFLSVSFYIAFFLRSDMRRHVAMTIGFVLGVGIFYQGIGYLFHLGGFGPAIFLVFLSGTQGAVAGAIILAIVRFGKNQLNHFQRKGDMSSS